MKPIKFEKLENYFSVLIDTNRGFKVWFDIEIKNFDINGDWNQYIFDLTNSRDLKVKEFQSKYINYQCCLSVSIEFLERNNQIYQNKSGNWCTI